MDDCVPYLATPVQNWNTPSAKAGIHSYPWPAKLTHLTHPFPFLSFCPTHWHIPSSVLPTASKTATSDTRLSTSGDTEGLQNIFTLCENPLKIKTLFFFTSLLRPSPTCAVSGWLDFVRERWPFPQFWLTSESSSTCIRWFHMGSVCTEGEVEGHIHPVCFSHFHCCGSPWFLLSVSSLGRHPSAGAFTLCSCSWSRGRDGNVWETKLEFSPSLNSASLKEPKRNLDRYYSLYNI